MARSRPQPPGYDFKGGSDDFGFLRTLDGHLAQDRFATGDAACENAYEEGRNANKDRFVVGCEPDEEY